MKEYKIVAGPKHLVVDKGNFIEAFDTFEAAINKRAADGWTYHSMETLTVTEKPGCAFFGTPTVANYYMLIFERDI